MKNMQWHRILAFVMTLCMLVSMCPISAFASETQDEVVTFSETSETAAHTYDNGFCTDADCEDPYQPAELVDGVYQITNGGNLYWFAKFVNSGNTSANAVLTEDITINSNVLTDGELNEGEFRSWDTSIGYFKSASDRAPYGGTFDGQNHTISGLYHDAGGNYFGLFGRAIQATIKNLTLADSYLKGGNKTGGVVGYASQNMMVQNCHVVDSRISGGEGVGGILGEFDQDALGDCAVSGCSNQNTIVTGRKEIGGVVGTVMGGDVVGCYNTGTISGTDSYNQGRVGGVVGTLSGNTYFDSNGSMTEIPGTMTRCYNTGAVSSTSNSKTGGVVGMNNFNCTVTYCYNTGDVANGGGVVGLNENVVSNCYNAGTVATAAYGFVYKNGSSGKLTDCFYLADDETEEVDELEGTTARNAEAFASGELAYLLNGSKSTGDLVWKQNVDTEPTDASPKFVGGVVYAAFDSCGKDAEVTYTNDGSATRPAHNYVEGTCTVCGAKDPNFEWVQKVNVDVDGTAEFTDETGNYANADTSALNPFYATVSLTGTHGTYSLGEKVTELTSGQKYLLWNTRAEKVLTNVASTNPSAGNATSALVLEGTTSSFENSAIWTITETNGGYTVQDLDGNYLTLGSATGAITSDATVLELNYVESGATWTIKGSANAYLNHHGGTAALGAGYAGPSTDSGSQWHIYALNEDVPGTTTITFTGVNPGFTSVKIGQTTYYVTVTGEGGVTKVETVKVAAGEDEVITLDGVNLEGQIGDAELNREIATVTVAGTAAGYEAGEAVTTLTSGKYLIKNNRHTGYMTTNSETSDPDNPTYIATGLHLTTLKGDGEGADVWTITATDTDGVYYVQSADNKYVTIGSHTASLTETPTGLTIAYNSNGGYWTLMENDYYLNHHGQDVHPNASGWKDATASTDSGSRFTLQQVNETELSTTITIHGVAVGQTSVAVGDTRYDITVLNGSNVEVEAGKDVVVTDETGNYTADTTDLDEEIATVTVSGTEAGYVQGEAVTALEDGGRYLIVNTRGQKALNNASATWNSHNGLGFSENTVLDETTIWTVEQVDGGYALKDLSGRYVTSGDNAASMGETADALTLAYVDGNWRLSKGDFYLNDGGNQHTCAYFWGNEAGYTPSTDEGSQWTIYKVTSTTASTTITFHGVAEGTTSVVVGNTKYTITVTAPVVQHTYENGFCTAHTDVCEQPYQPATLNDDGVYEIANGGQLYWFASYVNSGNTAANAKLVDNVYVNENVIVNGALVEDTSALRVWTPIGKYITYNNQVVYTGSFDGNNKTVSGLYFNDGTKSNVGLFGYIGVGASIANVGVINSYFYGQKYVGSVIGYGYHTDKNVPMHITNCWSDGSLVGANVYHAGGVAGCIDRHAVVADCRNNSTIFEGSKVGGILGESGIGTSVEGCVNTGSVTGKDCVGGIAGVNSTNGNFTKYFKKCYNTGTVSHGSGIVGQNSGTITDCYNTGNVSVSGIVGSMMTTRAAVANCYNIGTCGQQPVIGFVQSYFTEASVSNCYYLAESETDAREGTTFKTAQQFASGEVTYLLNGEKSEGTEEAPLVWFQNVDTEPTDASPKFVGGTVYKNGNAYSNTQQEHVCVFDQEVATPEHLATPATCQKAATYYKSCTCGENGTETFEHGDLGEHSYTDNGFCSVCDGYQEAQLVEGVYQITNAGNLYWLATQVNAGTLADADAIVTKDITVNEGTMNAETTGAREWIPIGGQVTAENLVCYTGTFDGNNKTISGLYFKDAAAEYVGLIGFTTGTVKNVNVANSYLWASEYLGSIVGRINGGTIENCSSSATIVVNNFSGGGIAGYAHSSVSDVSITGCSFTGELSTVSSSAVSVGGIAGYVIGSSDYTVNITKCCNTANISGVKKVAGIAGYLDWGHVNNCYNTGNISGTERVGGIVGEANNQSKDTYYVEKNYNSGTITGTSSYVGSITGYQHGIKHRENYYLTGTATDGKGKVQNGTGNKTQGKVTTDSSYATPKTAEQFASGEVAYLLNGSACEGELIWKQTLGENGDVSPNFTGAVVHAIYTTCSESSLTGYTNEAVAPKVDHVETSEITKEPTCTASGIKKISCSVCGDFIENTAVEALGHDFHDGECSRCGEKDPNYVPTPANKQVALKEGQSASFTDSTGNFQFADTSALNTDVATVAMTGTYGTFTRGDAVTELTSGQTYVLVNTRANKAMSNASATWQTSTGLAFSEASADVADVWIIQAVEGGYTVRNLNGQYLTAGQNTASVSETADVLTIEYVNSNWRISKDGYYLNDAGGQHTCAFFWQESGYDAPTDGGSQWAIYAAAEETTGTTQITFTGVKAGTTTVTIGATTYEITVTHEHSHTLEVAEDAHLKSAATCTAKAVYYKSCSCGENGTETFEFGDVDATNHTGTLGEWQKDEEKHWKEYSCCHAHAEEAAHKDENTDYLCDDCAYQLPQPAVDTVIRLEGQHRHETSLKTADEMKEVLGVEKFDTIIVADGYEFYDALSGSYLAAVKKAPILLSYSGDDKYAYLNDNNLDYIKANLAENGTVYILGGKNAVPTTYDTELENSKISVKRLDGAHRFDTNLMILEEAGVPAGSEILVCTSSSFADSLSAAATGKPILLVWNERGSLYGNQTTFLSGLENCTFTIIGGEGAVRKEFVDVLEGYGKVERLAGDNRLQTSVAVAERYFQNVDQAVLAYAWEFPDGLCGGSLAYAMKAPLILTMTGLESEAVKYATENGITSGIVLGGAARISDASVREIFAMAEDAEITVK